MALMHPLRSVLVSCVVTTTGCMAASADPYLDFAASQAQGTELRVVVLRVDDASFTSAREPSVRPANEIRALRDEEARSMTPVALLSITGPTTKVRAQGMERLRFAAASVGADALTNVRLGAISLTATAVRLPASGAKEGPR